MFDLQIIHYIMDSFHLTYVQYDQEACTNYWNYCLMLLIH
jgi:hypothetical protein